jgi:hypothetical protein
VPVPLIADLIDTSVDVEKSCNAAELVKSSVEEGKQKD